jgi:periplasmic divalent cation tolerance protein
MKDYLQVVTTTETEKDAQAIARAVVEQRLAGCVQVVGPITSVFWWQDQIEKAEEWLCLIKSRRDLYAALEQAILAVHPYDVPEILATPVTAGSKDYLEWLDSETRNSTATG